MKQYYTDNSSINKENLIKRLKKLNDYFSKRNFSYQIYLFGSCLGIYHLDKDFRKSLDIDYQSSTSIFDERIRSVMNDLEIHEIGGIMDIPPLDEIEIVETLKFGSLTVYIPSIENFALSKLLSNRLKDYTDLRDYPILDKCNLIKLKDMLDDYLDYFIFADKKDYNFNFFDDLLKERNLSMDTEKTASIENNIEDDFDIDI